MDDTLLAYGLLGLGLAFFALESFVPSYGALSLAGAVALGAGVWLLADAGVDTGVWVALGSVGTLAFLFALFASVKALSAHQRPAAVGLEHLVGMRGQVRESGDTSWALIDGARWRVFSSEPLLVGQSVVVEAIEPELRLRVRPELSETTTEVEHLGATVGL